MEVRWPLSTGLVAGVVLMQFCNRRAAGWVDVHALVMATLSAFLSCTLLTQILKVCLVPLLPSSLRALTHRCGCSQMAVGELRPNYTAYCAHLGGGGCSDAHFSFP